MENSRIKKASLNIIFLIIYEVATFVCNLILPRLIITTYGSAYNGLISSITQFLNFVAILRLGVAGATRVSLYKSLADDNIVETSAIVKATQNYMRKIGYVILAYVAVLAVIFPVFMNGTYGFINVAVLVVAIGLGTFAQYFFGITCRTLLQADQKLYINNIVQTISTILNTVLSSYLIIAGFSIQIVKLFSAAIFVISPLILNKYVIWKYKIDTKCKPDNTALKKKNDVMAHSIANIVHENTDVIVLTFFCDIKVVSVYTIYNLVMSGLKQVMNIFTTGIESVFGNMWAKGQKESIRKNLSYFEYMMSMFISIVFSVTAVLILPFVKLYTKGTSDIEYVLPTYAVVIILAQAFYCFRMPYLTLVQAAGHYKETKNGAFFEAGLNIISSIILVQFIGIVGTAVGTLLANTFRTIQYSVYVSRHLVKRDLSAVVKRLLWVFTNCAISIAICGRIIALNSDASWMMWIISGIVYVFVSSICSVVTSLLFYRDDAKGLLNIGIRMLKFK